MSDKTTETFEQAAGPGAAGMGSGIVWDGIVRGYAPPDELSISPRLRLQTAEDPDVDPISYEVIRNSLQNINLGQQPHSIIIQTGPAAGAISEPLSDFFKIQHTSSSARCWANAIISHIRTRARM